MDFRFQNNTDYPIKIESYLDKNHKLHVTIYGTDTTGIHGEPYHVVISTVPYKNTYQPKDSIPVGTEPQRDPNYSRYNGYTVDLYQKLVDKNGKTISTTLLYRNTYKASDAVYYYNPADAARWGLTLHRSENPYAGHPHPIAVPSPPCAQSDARRHSVARPNRHTCASPGAQSNCPPQPGVPAGIYPSCGGHRHTGIWRRSRHGAGGGDPGRHAGNRLHPGGRTLSGRRLTLKQEWRPKGPPLRLSITPPTKGFGGEDSVKGNRQGSLSRWIKQLFGTFPKFQKVRQPVEKTFSTG